MPCLCFSPLESSRSPSVLLFWDYPYGAPEPRKALGKRPEGVAHREVRDWPTRQDASLGQRRDPKLRRRGSVRHPGRAFFGFFLCTSKERNPPAVRGTAISFSPSAKPTQQIVWWVTAKTA